jgi:outer membrane protein TolC
MIRKFLAASLSLLCAVPFAPAQETSVTVERSDAPAIVRPYFAVEVPPVRLANSPRLRELVRAGILYLTVQDAIALALENNIDLEVARYNPLLADWRVTRSSAGGLLPGVPSNASQAGSVAAGQGVAGSQAAAGVKVPGTGTSRTQSTNATIQQIGPVTQTLDPIVQEASTFSHNSNPQANVVQSLTQNLITDTRASTLSIQQGTLTGGVVNLTFTEHYLNENAPTDVLNPSTAPNLSLTVQHNLLQGFGKKVNARTITVARMNRDMSDLAFQTQVIGVVAQVLSAYYGLAADYQDVKAKRSAAETAEAFFTNVKEQVRIGTLAPSDTIAAESQLVISRRSLSDSETSLQQQELQLKNLLSRDGTADPVLKSARIEPVDPIAIPQKDDIPPLEELVKQAVTNRTDLLTERQNEKAAEINSLGTRNGVRPTLGVFAGTSQAGLSGTGRTVSVGNVTQTADPYFVGGLGTALGQVFRRNFPSENGGLFYAAALRNRQAQSDFAIDQLQLRQTELTLQKDLAQVEVDVQNNVIALRQARARYEAAAQNRVLQEQLLTAEQKRFKLGASIPYNVIQQQRDLTAAQSTETAALVAYDTARIALDRSTGAILSANHVLLGEAREGKVARASVEPAKQ